MSHSGFATPEEAERAFYEAFENTDPRALMRVRADRESIECIQPMCDRAGDALLAVPAVHERISVSGENSQHYPVIATNIYQLVDDG